MPVKKTSVQTKNLLQPILVGLLVIAAFAIGSMWTQLKVLKSGQKIASPVPQAQQAAEPVVPAPKSDKPIVELFVMSYCPFGLQTQKAIVPVMELLKDKADIAVRFVYYAMHGQKEVEENLRQYCIEKEQNDKYIAYLRCFVASNDTASCQQKAGINTQKMQTCYTATDQQVGIMKAFNDKTTWLSGQFPLFSVEKTLNDKYKVGGSPTLVINGQQVNAPRSSDALKKVICEAFNNPPAECQKTLNTNAEQAGLGEIGVAPTGAQPANGTQCQ
ncbi:MAG: hypothetical protein NTZ93_01020 [Candidatus Beckwithbacteria bacterium]|nr:hypothetical protein [Candidatus Beckwithbacteria bacterium]